MPCSLCRLRPGRARIFLCSHAWDGRYLWFRPRIMMQSNSLTAVIMATKSICPLRVMELRLSGGKSSEAAAGDGKLAQLPGKRRLVFTLSMDALLYKMRAPEPFIEKFLTLRPEMVIPPPKLMETLIGLGYEQDGASGNAGLLFRPGRRPLEVYPPDAASLSHHFF